MSRRAHRRGGRRRARLGVARRRSELVSKEALAQRIAELGAAITPTTATTPAPRCRLEGAMAFVSDLSREIALPVDIDFMAVSSYGSAPRPRVSCAS